MITETINYYSQVQILELIAVVTALAYVIFAAKESIWCWPAALISTALYTIVFYEFYLWMDSVLQVYYFVMAIYGWYCWRESRNDNATGIKSLAGNVADNKSSLEISSLPLANHLKAIGLLAVLSFVVGFLMDNYTPTTFPYVDAATTVFAVYATYLVTQKVLENWLYWVVIDLVSIYVYIEKGLAPTAFLFVIYVFIAAAGYINWRGKYQRLQLA